MQLSMPKGNCKKMTKQKVILEAPFTDEKIKSLKACDMFYISGITYTGRDSAHKPLFEMIEKGEEMPFDFEGQAIHYARPCPAKPGRPIGSVGPTTSGRMDAYSPLLIEHGLKVMIGKGSRSTEVVNAIKNYTGVYFAAIGDAAALMALCVKSAEIIAFDDLDTEAIRKLKVDQLPVIVAIDSEDNNSYEIGREKYAMNIIASLFLVCLLNFQQILSLLRLLLFSSIQKK